jgi:hypothetical protein
MLQHEDITKVQELKGKFDKVWVSSEYLQAHLNICNYSTLNIAIVLKASNMFCPFLMQVSVTERITA